MNQKFSRLALTLAAFLILPACALIASCDNLLIGGSSGNSHSGKNGSSNDDAVNELIRELEQNGHYLKLYHLPAGTEKEFISNVKISDGSLTAAQVDGYGNILIQKENVTYRNAYIPLIAPSGAPFTRTGEFYAEFSVHIDALTKITVRLTHQVLVKFEEGRGELDIEKLVKSLPDIVDGAPDPETEQAIENIIAQGGYIRFYNLPRNISSSKFGNVSAANASRVIARCADYAAAAIRKSPVDAEAFLPLRESVSGNPPFTDTGSYYTTFAVAVDAVSQIIIDSNDRLLLPYIDGVTEVNVTSLPPPQERPPTKPNALTITGLPPTAHPANFAEVLVHNSEGITAKCEDYTKIEISNFNGLRAAVIPLVFDNNENFNGQKFTASGSFIVSFSFFSDAFQNIVVTLANNLIVPFIEGSGVTDVSGIPPAPVHYLTITSLPPNIQEYNIADVFVWNQAGKIGKCSNYAQCIITPYGPVSTLRVPLDYIHVSHTFLETGSYFVSFDLNIDALTRIRISENDRVLAYFLSGNGSLDTSDLPQAAPIPYLTMIGLPRNTSKASFSDVFVYNMAGKIAKCQNYQEIIITKNDDYASAMIPLVSFNNPAEYFRESGVFVVSFTVNVDSTVQIVKTQADEVAPAFTDGSALLDMAADYGFFSGGLVNPDNTSPPVIKRGTIFEINGSYFQVKNDTPVTPQSAAPLPDKTCLLYVYAVPKIGGIEFQYSTITPAFNPAKNAFYNGNRRALFALVYVKDSIDLYAAKTYIADPFTPFNHYTINNLALSNFSPDQLAYSLSGAANPPPQTWTPQAGWYAAQLKGGGGSGGCGINGAGDRDRPGGTGGEGGSISELLYLDGTTPLTAFTGSGGYATGYIGYGWFQGAGGGGGGSGSFLYSPEGYLLCAGGGGGGGGGGANDGTSGSGGGGGSIGSGGGGGAGGGDWEGTRWYPGSNGGAGGGYGGGAAGLITTTGTGGNGGNGANFGPPDVLWGYAGVRRETADDGGQNGGLGGNAAYYASPDSGDWKNTNGANGQGGFSAKGSPSGYAPGEAGGNNRNNIRGGGGASGIRGSHSDGAASAGKPGGPGSIIIYRIH